MDRFILNYNGNKYNECKKYLHDVDYENFDYVCEPFGGIFGFSRFVHTVNKNFKKFLINDIDKNIIDFYKELKNDFDATVQKYENEFNDYVKSNDPTKVSICSIIDYY